MSRDYDALIAGEYSGDVQFIESKSGAYFGDALTRSSTPTLWTLRAARFTENYGGEQVALSGYWIYKYGANMCWQAKNRGGWDLVYWNQDGQAAGTPKDRELFSFEGVSSADQTVKIYNASYDPFLIAVTGRVL